MDELSTIRAITCILKIDVINFHFDFKWKHLEESELSIQSYEREIQWQCARIFQVSFKDWKKCEWILADTGLPHWSDFTQFSETKRQ